MSFLDICWCSTLICLSTCLLAHCLSPSDQINLFIYSVQTHFLVTFGGKKKVISSWKSQLFQGLLLSYGYRMCWSLLVAPAPNCPHISPRFHVSSLSRASVLRCPLNYLTWFYLFCINVQVWSAIQEKMYSGLQTCSLDQHRPARELDFSAVVFSFAFAPLWEAGSTSPTFSLLPGLSLPWQLLSETAKKEPALQIVVYLAHCDFLKNLGLGLGIAT